MYKYFLKRFLMTIPSLLCIIFVVLLLINILPGTKGQVFDSYGGGDWLDRVFAKLDIENTVIANYVRYVYGLFTRLDFRGGLYNGIPMGEYLLVRLGYTLRLAVLCIIFSILVGVPAGIFAAVNHNKPQDQVVSILTMLLSSVPSYCLAIMLVVVFCLWLRILPVFGMDSAKSYVMPILVLSAGGLALVTRMTRSSVLDIMGKSYIKVLRAKGLSERSVILKHVLKNSLVTLFSILNNLVAQLICSTLVIENFFAFQGIGNMVVTSISHRNQPAVVGCIVVISAVLMMVSLLTDFLCALVNPQIRLKYNGRRKKKGEAKANEQTA